MSITVTETITLPRKQDDMFLSADLDVMQKLEDEVKERRPSLTIVWRNVAIFTALHLGALLGLFQFVFQAHWLTCLWVFALHVVGGFGITAGAHRLWSHRAYKATTPTRVALMLMNCIAFQNDIIEWARDHRCHHKWTDTEADPHNSKRGFFYSHVGWLLSKKTKQLKEMGRKIDLSDLYADPVLMFQRRHYYKLVILFCFLLPTFVPVYFWNESPFIAFYVAALFRYVFTLNSTWLINSAAHMFGYRAYDVTISPVESLWTNIQAVGEGGHNFHHTFPQDYRTSELSWMTNWTRAFIDGMAYFGLVYDLKQASDEAILRQRERKGDLSHHHHHR